MTFYSLSCRHPNIACSAFNNINFINSPIHLLNHSRFINQHFGDMHCIALLLALMFFLAQHFIILIKTTFISLFF